MSNSPLLSLRVLSPESVDRTIEYSIVKLLCLTPVELDGEKLVFKYRRSFDVPLMNKVRSVSVRSLNLSRDDVQSIFGQYSKVTFFDVVQKIHPIGKVDGKDLVEVMCLFKDLDVTARAFGGVFSSVRPGDVLYNLCPSYESFHKDFVLYNEISEYLNENIVGSVSNLVSHCFENDLVEFDTNDEFDEYFSTYCESVECDDEDASSVEDDEFDPLEHVSESVMSWYIVNPLFGSVLKDLGEIVGDLDNVYVWGRTVYGQSLVMDSVCQAAFVYHACRFA